MAPALRSLSAVDAGWVDDLLARELAGRMQARGGALVDALEGEGLVGLDASRAPVGLVTWVIGGPGSAPGEAEIRVLVVEPGHRRAGTGSRLLRAAEAALAARAVRVAWLVTTNDNLAALALYQRCGWRLAELRPGAVDVARDTLKPKIGLVAANGIPIRDELVLTKEL